MEPNQRAQWASDAIAVEGLEVECIIGLYEHERVTPQCIVVNAKMAVDTTLAALHERLDETVDYECVSMQIAFILKLGKFRLLETAAQAIARTLLLAPTGGEARGPIHAVELELRKPAALGGRGVPLLRVVRHASDVAIKQESKSFGSVDVIHETADVGLYRLNVFSGRQIAMHVHRKMQEAELVLSAGLHCQGAPVARGSVRQWPLGLPHHYENRTNEIQSLLCVDRPPFIEDDEVPCDEVAGVVGACSVWEV